MNSYVISPNVHFSYEQKVLFARKLTQAVHKQGEEKTFEYSGIRPKSMDNMWKSSFFSNILTYKYTA